MPINAFPIATVPPAANLIVNVPFGSVTATDVQAAINQLSGLIPSPGPGTDPLALTLGFNINTQDPTWNNNANDILTARFQTATDSSQNNPNFSNVNLSEFVILAINGQGTYGPETQCKITFLAQSLYGSYQGSGQKFLFYDQCFGYGMSDTGIGGWLCQYAGGPIAGDEGQCFMPVCSLQQQGGLTKCTISSIPTQSTLNTTVNQFGGIPASKDAQTVVVVNATAAVDGTWVVVQQELATPNQNMEAVKIISHSATSITGIFRCNHANGTTITPALRLIVSDTSSIGQDRFLVNMAVRAGTSYSTGTVTSITGGFACLGSGTTWAVNMVGGNAKNIGCLSLQADDYTGSPFDAGANRLRSWNAINVFTDATHLSCLSYSVAGDGAYKGKGPGGGTYTIRQSAKVLRITGVAGEVVCENSTSTWSVGDALEQAICPYPDVTGFQYHFSQYTNGGTLRAGMIFANVGARTFDTCLLINPQGIIPSTDTDPVEWGTAFLVQASANVGISLTPNIKQAAIRLQGGSGTLDAGGRILWGTGLGAGATGIGWNDTNQALSLFWGGGLTNAAMVAKLGGFGGNPNGNVPELEWYGWLHLMNPDSNSLRFVYFIMDNVQDQTNYERFFIRGTDNIHFGFKNETIQIGVERAGTGNSMDLAFLTGGLEQIRISPADASNNSANVRGRIKFTAVRNWSANGAVATSLTGIGPTGAATTVQKWLTIIDETDTTRYIPCF